MSKFKSVIIILGSLIIFIVASLATFLGLSFAGAIVTDPINLTYAISDVEKEYDGTPLVADTCELIEGELINGHFVVFDFEGSQTNVGSSSSDVTIKIVDTELRDVTKNYAIKIVPGTINVTKKNVSIKVQDCSVTYSGEEIFFDNYEVLEGSLVQGHQIKAQSNQVGSINVNDVLPSRAELQPMIYDIAGNDVTENYNITFSHGNIEILPRELEIKPKDYTKIYDGQPLVCEDYEIITGSLVPGHYLEAVYTTSDGNEASIVNVDESTRVKIASYTIYTYEGQNKVDVTDNYYVNAISEASFAITPREVYLVGENKEYTYTGNQISMDTVKTVESSNGLVAGETVEVTYEEVSRVNVTDEPISVKIEKYEISSGNSNYNVHLVNGSLAINKAKLTVFYEDIDQDYSGTKLNKASGDFIKHIESNVKNVKVEIRQEELNKALEKFKTAGIYNYSFDSTQIDVYVGSDDAKKNFDIEVIPGTVSINKLDIYITLSNFVTIYDGLEFEETAVKILNYNTSDYNVILTSETIKSVFKNIKNAGIYTYTIPADKLTINKNGVVLDNNSLNISIKEGTVVIEKAQLDITLSNYKNIDYTGEGIVIVNQGFAVEGTVNNETVKIENLKELLAQYKDAGSYVYTVDEENVLVLDGEKNVSTNYNISITSGTIDINKKILMISLDNHEKEYDGKSAVDLVNGDGVYFTEEVSVSIPTLRDELSKYVDAGEHKYNVDSATVVVYKDGQDVTKNYTVKVKEGTVVIKKKNITVTLASYTKEYDGLPVSASINSTTSSLPEVKVVIDSLQDELDKYVNVCTNQTYSVDKLQVALTKDGRNVTHNYNITVISGTITITKANISVQLKNYEKEYDGSPMSVSDTEEAGFTSNGLRAIVSGLTNAVRNFVNAGTHAYTVEATNVTLFNGSNNVTANYNITVAPGQITITKQELVVTLKSYLDKEYDGNGVVVEGQGFTSNVANASVSIPQLSQTLGQYKNAGVYTYTVSPENVIVTSAGRDITANYNITVVEGTIVIEKTNLFIELDSYEKEYDGLSVPFNGRGFNYNGIAMNDNVSIDNLGEIVAKYVDAGNYVYTVNPSDITIFGTGSINDYNINIVPGTIKITKKTLNITLANYEPKFYDGNPVSIENSGFTHTAISGVSVSIPTLSELVNRYTEVGSHTYTVSPEAVVVKLNGENVAHNYNISVVAGTITILSKGSVTYHVDNLYVFTQDSFEESDYSQEELSKLLIVDSFIAQKDGDVLDLSNIVITINKAAQTITATGNIKVVNNGTDVTENYNIQKTHDGQIFYLVH